jgi:hypothetical protein
VDRLSERETRRRGEAPIAFERTTDYVLIRQILTDPGIYRYMGDDSLPPAEKFEVNAHPLANYILAMRRCEIVGLFCLFPENAICWQAHVAMLRGVPPAVTHRAGRDIVAWVWANTACVRLIASVPACNRAAVRFGLTAMGLTEFGRNKASFMKAGRLWDQVLMGTSKP